MTGPLGNSPCNISGHRAHPIRMFGRRHSRRHLPGHTACMLEEREKMAQSLSTFAGPGVPEGLSPRACSVPAMLADGQGQRLWRGRGPAGTRVPAGTHSPTWVPPAKEQRGPAEKRDTFLSPRSLESGAFSFIADMVHFDSEHLESPCLSGAGVSPPHTPLPNLREKQNEGESVARAPRCGTPPPSAAPGSPLLPALSPTHQIALRRGPGPAAFYTPRPAGHSVHCDITAARPLFGAKVELSGSGCTEGNQARARARGGGS